jgi:hypothetical protein
MATRDRYPQPLDSMDWHRAQAFDLAWVKRGGFGGQNPRLRAGTVALLAGRISRAAVPTQTRRTPP